MSSSTELIQIRPERNIGEAKLEDEKLDLETCSSTRSVTEVSCLIEKANKAKDECRNASNRISLLQPNESSISRCLQEEIQCLIRTSPPKQLSRCILNRYRLSIIALLIIHHLGRWFFNLNIFFFRFSFLSTSRARCKVSYKF